MRARHGYRGGAERRRRRSPRRGHGRTAGGRCSSAGRASARSAATTAAPARRRPPAAPSAQLADPAPQTAPVGPARRVRAHRVRCRPRPVSTAALTRRAQGPGARIAGRTDRRRPGDRRRALQPRRDARPASGVDGQARHCGLRAASHRPQRDAEDAHRRGRGRRPGRARRRRRSDDHRDGRRAVPAHGVARRAREADAPRSRPRARRVGRHGRRLAGARDRRRSVRLVLDDSLFTGPRTGPGWDPADVTNGLVARVSALTRRREPRRARR